MTFLKLRKTMTLPNVIELKEDVMTKEFDSIQHAADVQLNTVAATLPPLERSFGLLSPKELIYEKVNG